MNWIGQLPNQLLAHDIERAVEVVGLVEMAAGAALMHKGHQTFMMAMHEMMMNGTHMNGPHTTGTHPPSPVPASTPEGTMPKIESRGAQ